MRLFSSISASYSVRVMMTSMSAMCATRKRVLMSFSPSKYERIRLRRRRAFPT